MIDMINQISSLCRPATRPLKRKLPLLKIVTLALALLGSQSCYAISSAGAGTKSVRWHPGNYVLVANHATSSDITSALNAGPRFRGIQKQYLWSDLERPDGFHFEEIGADLQTLRQSNKHLILQLQCKAFFVASDGRPNSSCPANLRGSAKPGGNGYYSGTYITKTGSLDPVIWDPAVTARMRYLYKALSQYLNANANVQALEAVCLSETAVSQDPNSKAMSNVMPYSSDAYATYLSYGFRELNDDLPHTVVIQYTNFGVGMDIVAPIVQLEKASGVGLGGPDLNPGNPGIQAPRGVYQQYINLAGDQSRPNAIPMGTAVQPPDTGPPPEQTYLFGKNTLHLNYIFWLNKSGYIDQVTRMLSDPSIVPQSDAAGGLDSRYPSSTSQYLN
jgi:hypothetical protein